MPPRPTRRLRGFILRALKIGAATGVTVVAFAGLVLYLDLSVTRRFVARVTNRALSPVFQGRIVIEHLGKLRLDGIDGARVRVLDPAGQVVFVVDGLRARVDTMRLLRGLLARPLRVDLDIPTASIDHVDFTLNTDAAGVPLVAAAFTPVPSPPSKGPSSPPTFVSVVIPHAQIKHAWVHGIPTWAPPLDADLMDVDAKVTVTDGGRVTVDVRHAELGARGLPIGSAGKGALAGKVLVPSEHGNAVGLDASFRGTFAGIDHAAHFSMDGDLMSGDLELKEVHPDKVRPFVPGYPLQDVLSLHASARGTYPNLDADARAELRTGGSVVTSGQVVLSHDRRASFHANVAALDLRGLAPALPESSLGAGIDATVAIDDDAVVTGQATIVAEGGTLGGQVLPDAVISATFRHGAKVGDRADATVVWRDPGLRGKAIVQLVPEGSSYELGFDASAKAAELGAVRRFAVPLRGSLEASAKGTLTLDTMQMTASFQAAAQNLTTPDHTLHLETATARGRVTGSIFLPSFEATAHMNALDFAAYHSDSADLTAHGLATAPHVHVTLLGGSCPNVDADSDLRIGRTTLLQNARARLSRDNDAVTVSASPVRIEPGRVSAEHVAVEGAGHPVHGQFSWSPRSVELLAESQGVDMATLSRLLRLPNWFSKGELAFDIDGKVVDQRADGTATIDLSNASIANIGAAQGHADLTLHDRHLRGHVHAEVADVGSADLVATSVEIGAGTLTSRTAWERVSGGMQLNADLDLARLLALAPKDALPVDVREGRLEVAAMMRRRGADDETPQLALTVKTSHLALAERRAASEPPSRPTDPLVIGPLNPPSGTAAPTDKTSAKSGDPPIGWRIEGVDFGIDGRIEAATGFAELDVRAIDKKGPLLSIDAKSSKVPFAALLAHPEGARELLAKLPIQTHLVVPRRDLADFPAALNIEQAEGALMADLEAKGTIADPALNLEMSLLHANADGVNVSLPVDLDLVARYEAGQADATLAARAGRHGDVMHAEAHMDGKLTEIILLGTRAPFRIGGRVHMEGFPLDRIGFLEDRQVGGSLSGDIVLKDFHKDASLTADLRVGGQKNLTIGEVTFKEAHVQAALDGHTFDVKAHLDHQDGSADAHAHAGEEWGDALFPRWEDAQGVDVTLSAKELRAETLLPFAHDTLAELEGRITGNLHLAFAGASGKPKLDGKAVFEKGRFEFGSALGEFHDATATLVLTPDGLITLENASASGVTGRVEGAASARLITSAAGALSLGSANATLSIPSKTPIPVLLEGTPLGTIDGTIKLTEQPAADGKAMRVGIDVPTLHLVVPESGSRSVQTLGDIDAARIEARRGTEVVSIPLGPEGGSKLRAADAKRVEIQVKLGDDVEVRRGKDLKVGLSGQIAITISDRSRVTGQFFLKKGGLLDIEGKAFEIESGSVTFVGDDPSNPQVVVTAAWTAPEGTNIYADFRGPLKSGKVTLRSQPPSSQADIVALLLFGSTEGSTGAGNDQTQTATNTAAGLAGNAAVAQPINHALDQFGVHAVSARIDNTQGSNPRPEVAVQIAKNVSVQLSYILGTPPPGQNPDTTFVTLTLHLLKALSLSTTVGDLGSSTVDMIWQRRY